MKITDNKIIDKESFYVKIKHSENIEQESYLWCNRIEYIADKDGEYFDHHLMFYLGKMLVFKIWLRNEPDDKPYKNIKEALRDVNIMV